MATKLQLITELSQNTAKDIVKTPGNWISFLKTAAWNYKYPFQDQLLIFAQRLMQQPVLPLKYGMRSSADG
ncbi:hypothetical protein [Ruminiclostridium josui]|uniref:hypothetical protein n=1 Tax=Ruminiclostridium josui TaxID=1499 RepID=UPI000AF654F4|nr:hypothetical protein [Ruminiclostridium josui]